MKSDALKNGIPLGDKANYWIQSEDHSDKSYKEYVQFVKTHTLTKVDARKKITFENSETIELFNTIFKSEDLSSIDFNNPTSPMIDELSKILDDEISNTKFSKLKISQQSSYFWNNLINQLVIGLVRINHETILTKYNSNIWKFTDDNYKNYGIEYNNEINVYHRVRSITYF